MYPEDRLLEYLKQLDEVSLLELLDLTSEDLVRAFRKRIHERRQEIEKEVEIIPLGDEEVLEEDYDTDGDYEDEEPYYDWEDE